MFAKVSEMWNGLSRQTQKRVVTIVTTLFTIAAPTYAGLKSGYDWWVKERFQVAGVTGPYAPIPFEKLPKEEADDIKKNYPFATVILIPNSTSTEIKNVSVTLPFANNPALLLNGDEIEWHGRYKGGMVIKSVLPSLMYTLVIWHKERLHDSDKLVVSSEHQGKQTFPLSDGTELVSIHYEWGFWALLIVLIAIGTRRAVDWLWRRHQSKQAQNYTI